MIISRFQSLEVFTTTILYQITTKVSGDKNLYVTNAIAKTQTLVNSIELTYKNALFNESWILFRCLLDRYLYLVYLQENKLFTDFKEWSFIKGFEYLQNAKSDEQTENVKNDPRFRQTREQSNSYYEKKKETNRFSKPQPKSLLKNEGLNCLYKFGYDYASMRVHPMFEDGDEEFHRITKLKPNPYEDFTHDQLLDNCYIVASMILQESINLLDLKALRVIYEYIEKLRNNENFEIPFYKIIKTAEKGGQLFEN